ncbi:hypothetical protein ABU614_06265 [Lysobacter firmicutimachus]|uniref:Uncharacterized protein n=1 Tax=Lysobacter firmicutimachus TaxID=1792846 RepID=A0AAU8MTE6_9GAMM
MTAAPPDRPAAFAADGPYAGLDPNLLAPELRRCLGEAGEDYLDALAGRAPRHAALEADAPMLSDGGSLSYLGRGYRLFVLKRLARLGGVDGLVYGPELRFDLTIAPQVPALSAIRFYAGDALRTLLGHRA